MHSPAPSPSRYQTGPARLAAALALLMVLSAGIFLIGRVAGSLAVSIALTGLWFVVVAGAAALVVWRHRPLLVPLGAAYAVVALTAGVLLGRPLLLDDTVDEQITMVADERPMTATSPSDARTLASGKFVARAHPGRGTATLLRRADSSRRLTLKNFGTDNGPDLRVYLVRGLKADGTFRDSVDLGALKGNRGNQEYAVPARSADYDGVVIWCRAFSVNFTSAPLT